MAVDSGTYLPASPESLSSRRRIAEALVKGGADYSPVGHWTQGMARIAQALSGTVLGRSAEGDDRRRTGVGRADEAKVAELLSGLPGLGGLGGTGPAAAQALAGGQQPAPAPQQEPIAPQLGPQPAPSALPGVSMAPGMESYATPTSPQTGAVPPPMSPTGQPQNATPAPVSGPAIPPQVATYIKALLANPGTRQYGMKLYEQYASPPKGTDDIREYEFAKSQGYDGSFTDFMMSMKKAGATTVNVGPTGIDYGTPDKGLVWARNPDNSVKLDERGAPIALPYQGGPVYRDAEDVERKKTERAQQRNIYADVVTEDIDRVLSLIKTAKVPITGLGSLASAVPGTPAHNASQLLNTIRANAGFDRLQQMREASPTGGALGPVSDFENRLLQATIGSLEQSQDDEQLSYNLRRVQDIYLDIIHGPGNRPKPDTTVQPKTEPAPQDGGWQDINGVRIRIKN